MPHKVNNFTDSSPSSPGSSNEQLNVSVVPDPRRSNPKVVIVHNGGGPRYDEKRPAGWDKNRWK